VNVLCKKFRVMSGGRWMSMGVGVDVRDSSSSTSAAYDYNQNSYSNPKTRAAHV